MCHVKVMYRLKNVCDIKNMSIKVAHPMKNVCDIKNVSRKSSVSFKKCVQFQKYHFWHEFHTIGNW